MLTLSAIYLLSPALQVRRTAAAEGEERRGRRQDADSLAALEEAEWMAARARLIKATLQVSDVGSGVGRWVRRWIGTSVGGI